MNRPSNPSDFPTPETIYKEFSQSVSRLCHRMLRNKETASDAAQDAWYQIIKSLPQFRGESQLSTWIFTIVRRAVMRHWTREKKYSTKFLSEYFALKEEDGIRELNEIPIQDRNAWIRLQCDDCLTGILHCLGNEDRLAYLLRVAGKLPFTQIALIMECKEEALRKSYERSRKKLASYLNSQCFLYNPKGTCRCKIKAPMLETDKKREYLKIRETAKSMIFLEAADSYHPSRDYWRNLIATLR